MYKHLYETEVAADPQAIWEFHCSKGAFDQLNSGSATMLSDPAILEEGAIHRIRFRLFGIIPLRWEAKLDQVTPPFGFTDQAVHSPFKMWRHRHEFQPVDGGTIVRDKVVLLMPFGKLGKIVYQLFVKKKLEADFAHRHRIYRELFGSSSDSKQ